MVDEDLVEGHIIPFPQMSFFCYPQWISLPDAEKEQSPKGTAPGSPRRATNTCSLLSPQPAVHAGKHLRKPWCQNTHTNARATATKTWSS